MLAYVADGFFDVSATLNTVTHNLTNLETFVLNACGTGINDTSAYDNSSMCIKIVENRGALLTGHLSTAIMDRFGLLYMFSSVYNAYGVNHSTNVAFCNELKSIGFFGRGNWLRSSTDNSILNNLHDDEGNMTTAYNWLPSLYYISYATLDSSTTGNLKNLGSGTEVTDVSITPNTRNISCRSLN